MQTTSGSFDSKRDIIS